MATTLSKELAKLKTKICDEYGNELHDVLALDAKIAECDNRLIAEIHSMTVEHEKRREMIGKQLSDLAQKMGKLPSHRDRPPRVPGPEETLPKFVNDHRARQDQALRQAPVPGSH